MYEINKNISTISCAETIIQQIGRKGTRENIFEAKLSLLRKWEKPPKSEKTADLLLYEKFMRSSINPFYEGVSRKCGLLFMKKCIMRGNGFRVSPWAYRSVITNESPVRIRNEELGMVVRRQILRLSSHCSAFTWSNIRHFTPLRMTKCAAECK